MLSGITKVDTFKAEGRLKDNKNTLNALAICKDINRILLKLLPSFLNIKVVCAPLYNIMCLEIDSKYSKKNGREQK